MACPWLSLCWDEAEGCVYKDLLPREEKCSGTPSLQHVCIYFTSEWTCQTLR